MKNHRHSGQALVEIALVLPLFIMIFIGIIDCARAFHCWSSINHMCVEACRIASQRKNFRVAVSLYRPDTHASMNDVVNEFWKYKSPMVASESMTGPVITGVASTSETVTISCTFQFTPWVPGVSKLLGSGGVISLNAFASQRKE